jgi:hypothetical protein
MKSLTANWKTTAAGIIALAITAIKIFYPSVLTTEAYTAILGVLGGLGLVAAKDGNVTGGTTPQ